MDGNIYPGQSGDPSLARHFTFFLKKVLFVGPQVPLFWTSGDVSPGFQNNVGSPHVQALSPACNGFVIFTSGVILADFLVTGMAADPCTHILFMPYLKTLLPYFSMDSVF